MNHLHRDTLHRTLKLELDESRASSLEEAEALAGRHVLQVVVGRGVAQSMTRQALLVTVLNTGPRAFIGGVRVCLLDDALLSIPWHCDLLLSAAIERYQASIVETLDDSYPTIVIGEADEDAVGSVVLYPTWDGWAAGIVRSEGKRLPEAQEFTVSGVLAGALAVSEAFQHIRGSVTAGHRDFGWSLWDLGSDWRDERARGPRRFYLPESLWLAGLGHLGQAYAWVLGLLPYTSHGGLHFALQDVDRLVVANEATSLLVDAAALPDAAVLGEKKTRLVARRLEELGVTTTLVERLLDEHTVRQDGEPYAVVGGFDDPAPRRLLESLGFARAFDAGIGRGPRGYLDIMIHSFPSQFAAPTAFQERAGRVASQSELPAAYARLLRELVEGGMTPEEARCGVVDEIAGRSVAASFVGGVAACLIVAEILRDLYGAGRYALIDLSLREPQALQTVKLEIPFDPASYGSIVSLGA